MVNNFPFEHAFVLIILTKHIPTYLHLHMLLCYHLCIKFIAHPFSSIEFGKLWTLNPFVSMLTLTVLIFFSVFLLVSISTRIPNYSKTWLFHAFLHLYTSSYHNRTPKTLFRYKVWIFGYQWGYPNIHNDGFRSRIFS